MANSVRTKKIEPTSSLDFSFWKRYEHSYNVARKIGQERRGSIESVYSFETKRPIQLQISGENTYEWFSPNELEVVEMEDPIFLKVEDVLKNIDLEVRNVGGLAYQLSGTKGLYEDATTKEHAVNMIHGINRSHPLVNGNKRASLTLASGFLGNNGYYIAPACNQDKTDFESALVEIIIKTASGEIDDQTLKISLLPFIHKGYSGRRLFSLMEEYPRLYEILGKN